MRLPTGLEEQLPPDLRKIVDVPPGSQERFRQYLMDPRFTRVRGPYNLFSPQYHMLTDRRVIKIVHATAIADWLASQPLPLRFVYLTRHPIPTALSMNRSNITLRASANLLHPGFCARHLDRDLLSYSWSVLRLGSDIERFVLEWCLDNLVPYRTWRDNPHRWSFVTYEELVLEPWRILPILGSELELLVTEDMMKLARVPSASTSASARKSLKASSISDWLDRWRSSVGPVMEDRAFKIIDRFGIELYERRRAIAAEAFLRFPETPGL